MNSRLCLVILTVISVLFAPTIRGQEDLLKDPDLQDALKQAKELEKESGPAKPAKLSELKKQADAIVAEQEKEEKKEKAELKKRLEKQLAEPGPASFPDWTPISPQFKATSSPTKKIVDDEVRLVQTGTSPVSPKELLAAWEKAVADKPLNRGKNDISVNGTITERLDLSTRTHPIERVVLEARREPDGKITEVAVYQPMPKPDEEDEE
jgi:hypothetical protein